MSASFAHQLVLADPTRDDGYDHTGEPGDCWRTCIANAIGARPADLPNFVRYHSWMEAARLWLADHGHDYGVLPGPEWLAGHRDEFAQDALFIVTGPSPRGPWLHCVLMDRDLQLIHDPHPSGDGILEPRTVELVTTWPLFPRPTRLMLEAAR